jgi:hypothetical protein
MTQPTEAAALAANGTGPQHAITAQPDHDGQQPRGWLTNVPKWWRTAWHDTANAVRSVIPVATSKAADSLIEEILIADGQPAAAAMFEAFATALRAHRDAVQPQLEVNAQGHPTGNYLPAPARDEQA